MATRSQAHSDLSGVPEVPGVQDIQDIQDIQEVPSAGEVPLVTELDESWLLAAAEAHIERFMARRDARTHLVAPGSFVEILRREGASEFTDSETLADVPRGAQFLIVASAHDEAALLAAARQRFSDRTVWGLHHHVIPLRVTDSRPKRQTPAAFRLVDARPHAVVCPARSGSTLLCEMLAASGVGDFREHLRSPLALALRIPGVDAAEVWRQVGGRCLRGGIFGTKLIATFLDQAAGKGSWDDVVRPLTQAGARFVFLRRSPIDTSVSSYVSMQTRRFHVRGDMSAEDRMRFEAVAYDFDTLRAFLQRRVDEAARCAAWASGMPPDRVLRLSYEELARAPFDVLGTVLEFLGASGDRDAVRHASLPVRISGEIANNATLRERFLGDLAQRAPELLDAANAA